MKKLISLLLCAAMLLTLIPAFAIGTTANELPEDSVEVWGFNGMAPGQITTNNWTWSTAGFFEGNGDTFMKAEITENGGVDNTQALKLTMLQEAVDADARFLCFLADGDSNNVKDWAGAEQLLFHVDASSFGTTETAFLRLRVSDEAGNAYAPANGKPFFLQADGASSWETGATELNAVSFPPGFCGWIRIPLTNGAFGPAYNGSTAAGQNTPDFNSRKVNLLWVQLTGKTSNADFVGDSVVIDAFTVSSQSSGLATFRFGGAFGDNMVLQANAPISVFGYGKAGQVLHIAVKCDKNGSILCQDDVTVDETGRWEFLSDTTAPAGFDTYTVTASRNDATQSIEGVLFGEVWVAGGQSNMEWLLSKDMDWQTVKNSERNANVRVMQVSGWSPQSECEDPDGSWKIANTWDNIADCSAIGYYFAQQLQEELGVPVGLISTAAGGTPLAAWLSHDILEKYPDFEETLTKRNYVNDNSWGSRHSQYNARIAPFAGMQASGIIWYQGCNESGNYDDAILEQGLPILYECWNGIFNRTEQPLAFYSVQLTPYLTSDLRRSQTDIAINKGTLAINEKTGKALSVPTYDVPLDWEANGTDGTNFDPIHPRTKKPIAQRLAAAALGNHYGKSTVFSGPVPKQFTYHDNGTVEIKFSNVGTGLAPVSGTELHGFLLAKENGSLIEASAAITAPDTLLLTPSESFGEKAVKAAYAYGDSMRIGNLSNSAGYLALTFYDTTVDEVPVLPVDPDDFTRKRVLNFEGLSGDLFESGMVSTDYGSTAVGAEAVADSGYEDSTALAYRYNSYDTSTYWSNSIVLNLSNIPQADTNWSGAGMFWFWVNTKELGSPVNLDLWLNGVKPALGTSIYSYDGQTIRHIGSMFDPWDGSGRLSLPADYTGFIGVPLSAYSGLNDLMVNNIYFYLESGKAFENTAVTLYLDEFWLTKMNEAPDVTGTPIVKDPFSLEVWDIDAAAEGFDNSTIHTHYNDALTEGNADAVIEDGTGFDESFGFGYVFDGAWTLDKGDNNLNFTNLTELGFVTDWTGADYIWFWVDNTDYAAATALRIYFNWCKPTVGAPFYTWDGTGDMVAAGVTVDAWDNAGFGKLPLPLNYQGFIALPLSCIAGLDTSEISQILLHLDAEGSDLEALPKTVWFDEFWITAEGSYPDLYACKHENTEVLAAVAPTCTEAGLTEGLKCKDCSEILTAQETVAALGHDFVDGVCTRCGENDPDYKPSTDPCEGYTDVDRNSWYHTAADFVIERGIMGSTKTTALTFEPTTSCTRAMIASMLYSLSGKPSVTFEAKFPDVNATAWYSNAVIWAYQNGVVNGYGNGNFGPNDKVTREQMAVILKAYTEKVAKKGTSKVADLSQFPDVGKVTWSEPYISWAVAEKLLSGKASGGKTYLDPQGFASRAEVAAIMRSFILNILES